MGANTSTEPKTDVKDDSKSYTEAEYKAMKADLRRLADNLGTITFNSVMGADKSDASTKKYPIGPDGKRLKPCCACPETKKARDACIIENGEENCSELIEAHKACMRNLGFNV